MRFLLVCLFLVASTSARAAPEIDIPFERFTLDNGLTVIVHEDRKAPVVGVSVWYKVGSKDEPEGRTGFAHLFEHLMFNGTEHFDGEWFEPLQEVGATDLNGTTNLDRTNYFQTVPRPALDRVLWMESDRMGHLLGAVTQEKLDQQRGVVQNEKRQGENRPYGRVYERLLKALYPPDHPYEHTTIGSMEDLDAATLEDVREWFRTYYGPSNAILVLAGDLDAEEARPLVARYFGDIPPGPPLTQLERWVPERGADTREVQYDQVPQARLYRVWVAPPDVDPVSTELAVAVSVLAQGKNARLYEDLVHEQQLATDVSPWIQEGRLASVFGVVVTVKPGASPVAASAALDRSLAAFLRRGPTREELERISTGIEADLVRGLEQVGGFRGKAVILAQGELVAGDPAFRFDTELAELEGVTPESVREAARRWLAEGSHQLDVRPFPSYAARGEGVDRSRGLPPVTGEAELNFPAVEEATLSNGIPVVFARRATVSVVNVALQFDAGYAADAGAAPGTAAFTLAMLDEGAGDRDALELSAALERLGARLRTDSTLDTSEVSLSALTEHLDDSLELLADVVRAPTFEAYELERVRRSWLAGIQQELANPRSIVLRLAPELMYGPEHPYGGSLTGSGTLASIAALTREDLEAFRRAWLRPERLTIHVVGDTTLEALLPRLEDAFGDWQVPAAPAPEKAVEPVSLPETPRVVLVDRPGSPQSYILVGQVSPSSRDDDRLAIDVMNRVLSGSFVSRLNLNLREEKGWSYGVRSGFVEAEGQRPFTIRAPVQTDRTADAIREIRRELEAFLGERPPTEEEVRRVKLDAVRSLPGRYETSRAVLASLQESARFDRPWNYPETLRAAYEALSAEDAAAAARRVLAPERMVWVIVGDVARIEAELRALELGAFEVRTLEAP